MDRAGREGERAFCLQAWNGDTGHTIDRIGRGTIHVEACCMSMLGGIQPGRLRSYLTEALEDGPSNDGLIQRFQLLVWPDTDPGWQYVDRPPDAASEEQVALVFGKLVELASESPVRYRYAPDAQELFVEWLAELETKVRGDELHPAVVSHLSKYRKLMPTLSVLFELAAWAARCETLHFWRDTAWQHGPPPSLRSGGSTDDILNGHCAHGEDAGNGDPPDGNCTPGAHRRTFRPLDASTTRVAVRGACQDRVHPGFHRSAPQ